MKNIEWFTVNDSKRKRQIKLNHRTVGYDVDSGEVYLPAAVWGGALRNFICMSADGMLLMYAYGALFCPASWLKKELPKLAADIDAVVAKVMSNAKVKILE